jgi:hypothetical protein
MLLARRLMSSKAPQQEGQRLKALKLAAREFNLSLAHYMSRSAPGYLQVTRAGVCVNPVAWRVLPARCTAQRRAVCPDAQCAGCIC